jgi:hypothetical protein
LASGDGSYSAELIGYVEMSGRYIAAIVNDMLPAATVAVRVRVALVSALGR